MGNTGGDVDLSVNPSRGSAPREKRPTSTALKVFGWLWCFGMSISAVALAVTGSFLPALAYALSAFLAAPPSWRVLARNGISATRGQQIAAVIVPYVAGAIIAVATHAQPFGAIDPAKQVVAAKPAAVATREVPSSERTVSTAQSKADTVKAMTAKINDISLLPLDRKYDPEGYAKLGKRVWDVSNELRLWAGLAALQNDSCKGVSAIAVWERATRSRLSWHVVCGDERFVISEEQARSVRAQLDPDATDADRKSAGPVQAVQPMSAVFANFDPQVALRNCETAMKDASVNKGSFASSGVPEFSRNDEAAQVTLAGEFSASNAYGGTLSGKYYCVVSAADGSVASLTTRDALGSHVIIE